MTPFDGPCCAGNHKPVRPLPSPDLKRTSSHFAPTRSGRSWSMRSGCRNTFVQPESRSAAASAAVLIIEDPVEPAFPVRPAQQELGAHGAVARGRPVEARAQAVVRRLVAERLGR